MSHQAAPVATSPMSTTPTTIPAIAPPEIELFEGVCVTEVEGFEVVVEVVEFADVDVAA
jgi:hypothetical protein